ncbi:hypothetical protein GWK48_03405 [Metallosphaera tengchongensis]|uniref:Uncharacterized protein n=1 Tax=Metallosphaera tengchongensis TaxID=1532350 RepID=A0A6N0NS23_9CREN|nr:hypothetical protein [Metallosphaera tengchongensis]QKQ99565.1 hypothetical protein GWK48_03405 [Metallosphaera tengchongensis]
MRLKISLIEISSEVIPHHLNESDDDISTVSHLLVEALTKGMPSEVVDIDEGKVFMASLLSSRLIEGIPYNLDPSRWGGKYYSGDVSATIGETLTYAFLEEKFDVKFTDIVPLRQVKYLGYSPDALVDAGKSPTLLTYLGGKGFLFINARGSFRWSQNWLTRNLVRDLIQVEKIRYPDNYGLLSYVYRDEGWNLAGVVIRP